MASDRQRFWWRVDRALRELALGDEIEIRDGGMRGVVQSLPGANGRPRFRIYVEVGPSPSTPPPVDPLAAKIFPGRDP